MRNSVSIYGILWRGGRKKQGPADGVPPGQDHSIKNAVNRIDYFAGFDIDKQCIVIIADPLIGVIGIGQVKIIGIVDPVTLIEQNVT